MVAFIHKTVSALILLLGVLARAEDNSDELCGREEFQWINKRSQDPLSDLGGAANIDRITRIELHSARNLIFPRTIRVVSRVTVHYVEKAVE